MRRPLLIAVLALLSLAGVARGFILLSKSGEEMTASAEKFLGTLSAEQKKQTQLAYDIPTRVDWHFIPKATRKGLQLREMNDHQRQAAHTLLKSALSEIGYGKATKIISLEALLKELEKSKTGTPLRDTERYFFTVFGEPTRDGKWGLSVEGHHLSLNFVVEKGHVISSTPAAFCTNPAEVKGDYLPSIPKGTQILAKEESLAFDLLKSLSADQKKKAIIADKAPSEVRAAGEVQPPREAAAGIAASELSAEQKQTLSALLAVYAGNWPADVAAEKQAQIEKAGIDKVHFAWAGAEKPGVGHYYRIQGPTFVIEFVNVQPDAAGNPANHIHSLWRDMAGDFALPIGGGK